MIGQTVSHYKILENPPTLSGQVGGGGMSHNHPRALCASGCDCEDPALFLREVLL